jgi:chromosome segregation ATPase
MAKGEKKPVQPEPELLHPTLEKRPPEPLVEALKTPDEIVQSAPDVMVMREQIEELIKANAHKNLFGDRLNAIYEMLANGDPNRAHTMLEEAMKLLGSYTDDVKRLADSSEAFEQATREVKASYEDVLRVLISRGSEPVDVSWREGFQRIEKLENLLKELDASTAEGFSGFDALNQKFNDLQTRVAELETKKADMEKRNTELDELQKRMAEIAEQQKANDQTQRVADLQDLVDKLSGQIHKLQKQPTALAEDEVKE